MDKSDQKDKMEIEQNTQNKQNTISMLIDGKIEKFMLLTDIRKKCDAFIEDIKSGKTKTLDEFREIIYNIEASSEFNFYFLKFLKETGLSYEEEGQKWDYESNYEALKDTLTKEQVNILNDPLKEIQLLLKELAYKKEELTDEMKNSKYDNIVKKYSKTFNKLNFPLIDCIESLRLKYYKELILDNDISQHCYEMKDYIDIMDKDENIFNNHLDEQALNTKTYLLIFTLTTTFEPLNEKYINNFFKKTLTNDDITGDYTYIKHLGDDKYRVNTEVENRIINGKDYILSGLNHEIGIWIRLPIDILLLRNESYEKFISDGGKGYIHKLGLYDKFINYIKYFLKSNAISELLSSEEGLKYNRIFLEKEHFLDEMLNEKYLRFLPFYGSKGFYGYTNKDIMVSFINSIPGIPDDLSLSKDAKEQEIKNIYHICLLFSIGEKFVTSLHEFAIYLVSSYIYFVSSKKISSNSYKEECDEDDGGYFFERKIKGSQRFKFLTINNIIVLLDGVSCQKSLSEFRNKLNSNIDVKDLKERIAKGEIGGFLKDFLDKFPIEFDIFKNLKKKNPQISCGKYAGIGISMDRRKPDKYGGGEAKLYKK